MRLISDKTGMYKVRPYYEEGEIDSICEKILTDFLLKTTGRVKFPISTECIEILIENHVEDLDSHADLTKEGTNIDGMTEFNINTKPNVYISKHLAEGKLENRRRTTLTHEFGHVILHQCLWKELAQQEQFFKTENIAFRCKRENIIHAKQYDWKEWQAGYASGAFLMPITYIRGVVNEVHNLIKSDDPIYINSNWGIGLVTRVKKAFSVSGDAARVRLCQLGFATNNETLDLTK